MSKPVLPDRIGSRRVLGVLGSGMRAVVYRAHDPALGVDVAVKVLAEPHAQDPKLRADFVAAVQTFRGFSGDRIVTVYDTGEFERRPYLVMELIDGGALEDRLEDEQTFGPAEIEWLVTELGAAIVVVLSVGLVHRDIRPGNVLIRNVAPGEQVLLTDLGLARETDQRHLAAAAEADAYTAPEQRIPGAAIDGRTDVYSASGVIGRAAFGSEWHRILVPNGPHQATAPEPSGTEPLAFELRRGLSANPAERHASISEWIEAVSDAATDHAAVTQTAYEAATPRRPVMRLFAAGLIVLAMVMALATVTTQ